MPSEADSSSTDGNTSEMGIRRRSIIAGAAWATPVIMFASASPASAASISGMRCELSQSFMNTRSGGRFIGGNLLGLDLDSLAEVRGIDVINTPMGGTPAVVYDPVSAVPMAAVPPHAQDSQDAWGSPLSLSVLNALDVVLGPATHSIGTLLSLSETGVVSQYGMARENGATHGFAGLVANAGPVTLSGVGNAPDLASVDLKTIVTRLAGSEMAAVVDPLISLDMRIGALGAEIRNDACTSAISRDYLITALETTAGSDVIAAQTREVTGEGKLLDGIQTTVNALTGPGGLVTILVDDVLGKLTGLLGILLNAQTTRRITSVAVDLQPVRDLLDRTISTDALTFHLSNPSKMLTFDLNAVTGGLNGKAPNTELLINEPLLNEVLGDAAAVLNQLPIEVRSALDSAVDAIRVQVDLGVSLRLPVLGTEVATLDVLLDTTVGQLASGNAEFSLKLNRQSGLLLSGAVTRLLNGLVESLTPLVNILLQPLGVAIRELLLDQLVEIGSVLEGIAAPTIGLSNDLLGGLFGSNGVVNLMVNVQNNPENLGELPSVAALQLEILPTLPNGIQVTLARAYAGEYFPTGQ